MMKGLAESGLVDYQPYEGVRLTAAGEKLASSVLRRHRLIEAFLVKVVGMSWVEVHEEAERSLTACSRRRKAGDAWQSRGLENPSERHRLSK